MFSLIELTFTFLWINFEFCLTILLIIFSQFDLFASHFQKYYFLLINNKTIKYLKQKAGSSFSTLSLTPIPWEAI